MAYLVLAYPQIKIPDFDLIQNYRSKNDKLYYTVVEPHFTIVFPVVDQTEANFVSEIKKQTEKCKSFDFVIRCATINKDAFKEHFHTFLVPDEGYSNIIKIHDQLYSGTLKQNLRLDLDYIPHISIGNSLDKFACKRMVDEWNSTEFEIKGKLTTLTIVKYENDSIKKLRTLS